MNKVLLELPALLVQEVLLAILVPLAKMVLMVFPVLLAHQVPVVAMEMLVPLVPQDLLAHPVLLAHPAADLTSASCLNHQSRNPIMVADTTELMMPTQCVTATWKWTPP